MLDDRRIIASGSGHYIQLDDPQLVIKAILQVLETPMPKYVI